MKPRKREKKITLTEEKIREMQKGLPHGSKTELANILDVSHAMITNIFKPSFEYDTATKEFYPVYKMKESYFKKIEIFINSIKD